MRSLRASTVASTKATLSDARQLRQRPQLRQQRRRLQRPQQRQRQRQQHQEEQQEEQQQRYSPPLAAVPPRQPHLAQQEQRQGPKQQSLPPQQRQPVPLPDSQQGSTSPHQPRKRTREDYEAGPHVDSQWAMEQPGATAIDSSFLDEVLLLRAKHEAAFTADKQATLRSACEWASELPAAQPSKQITWANASERAIPVIIARPGHSANSNCVVVTPDAAQESIPEQIACLQIRR
eukprot:COSAG01_NODE_824_length_13299_cov_22.451364_8_plen_234_part_00